MEALLKKACLIWVYLAGILLLSIILVTVYNISAFGLDKIARVYDFNISGIPGYEDFIRLTMSCVALMFFPWTQLKRGHVSVDFFTEKLSSKTQLILDKVGLVLTLVFVLFLSVYMYDGLLESKEDGAMSSVLGWIEWPFYIPGIISLILWAMVLFYQIFFQNRSHLND